MLWLPISKLEFRQSSDRINPLAYYAGHSYVHNCEGKDIQTYLCKESQTGGINCQATLIVLENKEFTIDEFHNHPPETTKDLVGGSTREDSAAPQLTQRNIRRDEPGTSFDQSRKEEASLASKSLPFGINTCQICEHRKALSRRYGSLGPVCQPCTCFFYARNTRVRKDEEKCVCESKLSNNYCGYCRYQKCLQFGMKEDLVRRWTTTAFAALQLTEQEDESEKEETQVEEEQQIVGPEEGIQVREVNSPDLNEDGEYSKFLAIAIKTAHNFVRPKTVSFLKFELIVSKPPPRVVNRKMMEAAGRIFFFTLSWANNQPFFKTFSFDIQSSILEWTWAYLFILTLLELHHKDFQIEFEMNRIPEFKNILEDIHSLKFNGFEYEAIKTAALFAPACYKELGFIWMSTVNIVKEGIITQWRKYLNLSKNPNPKVRVDKAFNLLQKIIDITETDYFRKTFCEKYLMSFDKIVISIPMLIGETELFKNLTEQMEKEGFWWDKPLETIILKFSIEAGVIFTK